MSETTIVLSDLHANARALRRALEIGRTRHVDRWVVLGDLLTYGINVNEVLDLVEELATTTGAPVVRGNHDQLYFDLEAGDRTYYDRLPDWIRESVDYSRELLDAARFARRFAWCDEVVAGDVLFSHASPYGSGDWRYLTTEQELAGAAERVRERGFRVGVFGHVHRHRIVMLDATGGRSYLDGDATVPPGSVAAITAGSLGQPRDKQRPASMVFLDVDGASYRTELVPVEYDVAAHMAAIRATTMSEPTQRKLCEFFSLG